MTGGRRVATWDVAPSQRNPTGRGGSQNLPETSNIITLLEITHLFGLINFVHEIDHLFGMINFVHDFEAPFFIDGPFE